MPIRLGLDARHYKFPKTHNHVAKLVKQYATEVREMNRDIISRMLKDDFRFSITLDEHTRRGNRKLCNINLHIPDGDFLRIGMIRIRGSATSEVVKDVVNKKLSECGIDLDKDCICHTVDGASVCRKLGKLLKMPQQVCLAHAMHLAVCDVLYEKKNSNRTEDMETDGEEEWIDDDNDEYGDDWLAEESATEPELIVCTLVIGKVRKIVVKFRRSTVSNDALQDEVQRVLGKERQLLIDVK